MRLLRLRLLGLALCVLACVYTASAQNVVTGTIHDPNGNAYANGSASALLAVVSGQVQPPSTNVTTNGAGFFTMTLATGSYSFIVCAAPTGLPPVNPVANPTPRQICFQSAPILINTNPQDVSTTLNSIALSLGPQGSSVGGVSNPSSLNNIIFVDGGTYTTIQAAVNAAAALNPVGAVVIPPTFGGSSVYTNASNVLVIDWRSKNLTISTSVGAAFGSIAPFNIANYCGSSSNYLTTFTLNGYQPCAEQTMFFGAPQTGAGFGTFVHRVDLITQVGVNVQSAVAEGDFATCHGNNSGGTALGVTCNTSTTVNPATRLLASSVAATSFTINLGTVTTNPACFSYWIVN